MVEDDRLLPVRPDALPEGFFARESVIQGGDASLMGDHATRHTLHPDIIKYKHLPNTTFVLQYRTI